MEILILFGILAAFAWWNRRQRPAWIGYRIGIDNQAATYIVCEGKMRWVPTTRTGSTSVNAVLYANWDQWRYDEK